MAQPKEDEEGVGLGGEEGPTTGIPIDRIFTVTSNSVELKTGTKI